ncbi:shieldin complex subunit 3-like [Ochotona curzoniae]|uniref:shieldin complex subunit 3-like n=1 Tax=Ochotona curzoniae TaxID=130825 RepID=UPI001B34A5CA|nr:shieldin complex subunit 3-like [Ochotona curzoniae]
MITEITLHYRPCENDSAQPSKIAEKVIQVRFIPWFPYDGSRLPVKPKRSLPALSREAVKDVKLSLTVFEQEVISQSYGCAVGLWEFQPGLKRQPLMQSHSLEVQVPPAQLQKQSEKGKKKHKRRPWGVSPPHSHCTGEILPLFKNIARHLEDTNFTFAFRWTIEHTIFHHQTPEDIWSKPNRIIGPNELPSCNATIQRYLSLVWVLYDIIYCEYVGNLLKKRIRSYWKNEFICS